MASEQYLEVYRTLQSSQQRHVYALLAAAGACIAAAVSHTATDSFSHTHWIWVLAVSAWGGSVFSGLRKVEASHTLLHNNGELILMHQGRHPITGSNHEAISIASDVVESAMKKNNDDVSLFSRLQVILLMVGGFIYLLFHLSEMALR